MNSWSQSCELMVCEFMVCETETIMVYWSQSPRHAGKVRSRRSRPEAPALRRSASRTARRGHERQRPPRLRVAVGQVWLVCPYFQGTPAPKRWVFHLRSLSNRTEGVPSKKDRPISQPKQNPKLSHFSAHPWDQAIHHELGSPRPPGARKAAASSNRSSNLG